MIIWTYETVFYMIMFVTLLVLGAFVNSEFGLHRNLLKKDKGIISNYLALADQFVGKDSIDPDSRIYVEGLRYMKKELGDDNFKEKMKERCTILNYIFDEMIEELEYEEINNPFTVVGIPVNKIVLQKLAVGVGSVTFAVIQKLVANK